MHFSRGEASFGDDKHGWQTRPLCTGRLQPQRLHTFKDGPLGTRGFGGGKLRAKGAVAGITAHLPPQP